MYWFADVWLVTGYVNLNALAHGAICVSPLENVSCNIGAVSESWHTVRFPPLCWHLGKLRRQLHVLSSAIFLSRTYRVCRSTNMEMCVYHTRFFFYKNKLYKNTQAEICPKIKNKLRTITRLKIWSKNLRKLFNFCRQMEMYSYTKIIGCWKSDKQACDVRGHCIDSFMFFRIPLVKCRVSTISRRNSCWYICNTWNKVYSSLITCITGLEKDYC